ncbi:MAG: alpha/beta fold hydrolase [Kiritimatiellia bacterium]
MADSTVTFWMKIEGITEGCPGINLFEAVVNPASRYLDDKETANFQATKTRAAIISADDGTEIPRGLIRTNGEVSPFLFEGRGGGKGRLVLLAKRGNLVLAETAVTLEIKPVEWFYDRYTVSVTSPDNTDPWNVTVSQTAFHEYTGGYTPATDEVFLLVHGWNMSEFEKRRWAETAFKRLWWQGYQGRVILFSWPTLQNPEYFLTKAIWDPRNFDNSEIRAWRSAAALSSLFQTLGPARLRVMAHSMGNIVASEALKLHTGPPVHSYIACQAALSAQYYNNLNAAIRPCPPSGALFPTTPDVMGHYFEGQAPSVEYFAGLGQKVSSAYNYCNPYDWALRIWEINNAHRPDGVYGFMYAGSDLRYSPGSPDFDRFYRLGTFLNYPYPFDNLDERYVIFSYMAESRSTALGAWDCAKVFRGNVGLDLNCGYDGQHYSHSRQFRSNILDESRFWNRVCKDFGFVGTVSP